MWFKNLKVFRLNPDWSCTADSLAASLASEQFAPADSHAAVASGWVAPTPHDERLAYGVTGQMLCSFRSEKKLLPASVINQFVKARAQELEEQQGFKPGRKQMRDLKAMNMDKTPNANVHAKTLASKSDRLAQAANTPKPYEPKK